MTATTMCPDSAERPQAGTHRGGRPPQQKTNPTSPAKLCVVVGLVALLLIAGCRDTTPRPSDPSKDAKGKDGAAGGDKKGKGEAEQDQSGSGCPYDESLTKYLPESTNRIEVMDFQAARSNPLLDITLKGLLQQGSFGSWNHKQQGIGMLKQAGITEDTVKNLTLVRLQDFREPVVFMRFSKVPDQRQYVEGLKATPAQVGGKTCYEVRLLNATLLHHVHFLEPSLFVFSRDAKAIARVADARTPPAVSPDLLQAIRLTRGGRPTAALAANGGLIGISPFVADFFRTFTRAEASLFELSGKAKAIAYWYAPAERGFHTHFACLYSDAATASQAEAKATETIQLIRKAYASERQTTVPELRSAAIHMFEQMSCGRSGMVVTVSWPFGAEFVHHYWAPR
jgi:hypothetical protein